MSPAKFVMLIIMMMPAWPNRPTTAVVCQEAEDESERAIIDGCTSVLQAIYPKEAFNKAVLY